MGFKVCWKRSVLIVSHNLNCGFLFLCSILYWNEYKCVRLCLWKLDTTVFVESWLVHIYLLWKVNTLKEFINEIKYYFAHKQFFCFDLSMSMFIVQWILRLNAIRKKAGQCVWIHFIRSFGHFICLLETCMLLSSISAEQSLWFWGGVEWSISQNYSAQIFISSGVAAFDFQALHYIYLPYMSGIPFRWFST